MTARRIGLALGAMAAALVASSTTRPVTRLAAQTLPPPAAQGVVAHEWGTFTTVANEKGQSTEWLPLSGQHDLPCFVDYFNTREVKVLGPNYGAVLNYEQARSRLRGTVRMETPVIYFYADHETSVDVAVKFPSGLFTEWYPAAQVAQAGFQENLLAKLPTVGSEIRWKNVRIEPAATEVLPVEKAASHYYAARRTDAAPIRVGTEQEKFLFYRGIGGFAVPISATTAAEDSVIVKNLGTAPLPGVVLFSREHGQVSFRIYGTLKGQITLNTSPRDTDLTVLKAYLHTTLVAAGLYPREAQAMLDTWDDTWFEEGTRLFYVLPQATVDAMLPLAISPAPSATARAFVGRVEVITPDMEDEVGRAFATDDRATLARYGRLIGPIADRVMAKTTSAAVKARISSMLTDRLKAFVSSPGC